MSREQFDALPDEITVREVRYDVNRKGFRVKKVTLVTTLLDDEIYSLRELAELYNLARQVMVKAAIRQKVGVNRISFIDALRWLKSAEEGDELRDLGILPERPNRYEARVRKRRPKNYRLMTKPRKQLKQELAGKGFTEILMPFGAGVPRVK